MKLRIHACGIHDCSPGWNWTTQKEGFPDYDLWAVFRGQGTLEPHAEEQPVYRLYNGVVMLLAPDVQYAARHDPTQPLFVVNVHFDFLDEEGKSIRPRKIEAACVTDPDFFKTLLTRCVTMFHTNRPEEANRFLAAALAEFSASEKYTQQQTDSQWRTIIGEMARQIDLSPKAPTLGAFADKYGYSQRYLGKKFRQVCGIGFSEYVCNARISKAKLLLRNSGDSVAEIAEQTGFCDTCHFVRTFHREVGVPPLVYRRNN